MKKKVCLVFVLLFTISFYGCGQKEVNTDTKNETKPIEITKVKEEVKPIDLDYIGVVTANEIKKIGFKSAGKIEKLYVEKGMEVKKGDKLAQLDSTDMQYAVDAAKAQYEGAKAQYEKALNGADQEDINNAALNVKKAEDAYKFSLDNFDKFKKLYNEDAISKLEFDQAELDLNLKEASLNQAKEIYTQVLNGARGEDKKALASQMEAAKADYEYKLNTLNDTVLYSDVDGYIVDVLNEEGEIVDAGYPVVVVRNDKMIVQTGLSQKDILKIKLGDKVKVSTEEEEGMGVISNIAEIPDEETRTYNVEISLEENLFKIGWIVKCKIYIGEERGIWIPISAILSNGKDYVFINDKGIARKLEVSIEEVDGFNAHVIGLKERDQLIIKGMKRLIDGDPVNVQEEE